MYVGMLKKFFFVVFENKYFGLFVNVIQLLLGRFEEKIKWKIYLEYVVAPVCGTFVVKRTN
jgi:hypothetical protein